MARGFGRTALRAALGGIAGGLEGLGAMREEERVRKEAEAARQRQAAMDRVGLQNQGYETAEDMARLREGGREAVFRTVFGPASQRQAGDLQKVDVALGAASPRQTVNLGGVKYERESPVARALRTASAEQMRAKNKELAEQAQQTQTREATIANIMEAEGVNRAQAIRMMDSKMGATALGFKKAPMTESDRLGWARFGLEKEKFEREKTTGPAGTPGGRRAGASDKTQLATTLPSVLEAADRLNKMDSSYITKLRPAVMDAASAAGTASGGLFGDLTGPLTRYGVARFGKPTAEELQYVQQANAIADAIARATDVGVLANFDIVRFRTQVTPTALDAGNPKSAEFKFNVLKGWANWLANNREMLQAADAAYEAGKPLPDSQLRWKGTPPPVDGVGQVIGQQERRGATQAPAAQASEQDDVYEQAKARINAGADRQAVIQKYESLTGRKWPGG